MRSRTFQFEVRAGGAKADPVDKAHTLLAQSNFELAAQFLDRALELEPTNLEARELIGVTHLEAGDPEVGRTVGTLYIRESSAHENSISYSSYLRTQQNRPPHLQSTCT